MNFLYDKVSEDSFYSNLLIGLPQALDLLGLDQQTLFREKGVPESDLVQWEAKNGVHLPDDLRDFYSAIDGLYYTWAIMDLGGAITGEKKDYVMDEEGNLITSDSLVAGRIKINGLSQLKQLHGYLTASHPEVLMNGKHYELQLGNESKVFSLDTLECESQIALVYLTSRYLPTIWIRNPAKGFYFLADNFTSYLRMCIAHLGVPGWQHIYTPYGTSQLCVELLQVFIPHVFPVGAKRRSSTSKKNDDDFPEVPVNEVGPEIFYQASKNMSTTPTSSLLDMNMPATSKKLEKKTTKSTPPKKPLKRKPLYYIKQYPH